MKIRSPEEVMREVTTDIIRRALKFAQKKGRTIFISKTANGKGVDISTLNPKTAEGKNNLEKFLTPTAHHYTISGLGAPEEPNSIHWRALNLPLWRRFLVLFQSSLSFLFKGTPFKIKWYRWMGFNIGKNVEIMQLVWLDHFRPELIFIGDHTLIGAFTRITCHAYEGCGKFRYGLVEIGSDCTIGAGAGIGMIRIEDHVRILPGTIVSPYLARIREGSVVGYNPPPVKLPVNGKSSSEPSDIKPEI